jgi:hypothetical protein
MSIYPAQEMRGRGHHAAIPSEEIPKFGRTLRRRKSVPARALVHDPDKWEPVFGIMV